MTSLSIEQETFKPFFQLSKQAIQKIWSTKLSGNDWKVYSFLSLIDPFGDRWCELPEIENICQLLTMSQASFYRALSKLKESELINTEDKGWRFKNILAFAKMRGDSQNCETILKNEKPVAKMRNDSQNCENQSSKGLENKDSSFSQTIQTVQTIQTLSDSSNSERQVKERESIDLKEEEEIKKAIEESIREDTVFNNSELAEAVINQSAISQPQPEIKSWENNLTLNLDNSSADCSKFEQNRQQKTKNSAHNLCPSPEELEQEDLKGWENLPEGEWQDKEKLNLEFFNWLARDWAKRYHYSINTAKCNIRIHFANKPHKIKHYWNQFQGECNLKQKRQEMLVEWKTGEWITIQEYDRRIAERQKGNYVPEAKNLINCFLKVLGNKNYAT